MPELAPTDQILLVLIALALFGAFCTDEISYHLQRKAHRMSNNPIDMDALLAQREEATGSADTFAFTFKGQEWLCQDPVTSTDDWKEGLYELDTDVEVAEYYLGAEQYAKFLEAGGRAGYVVLAINQYMQQAQREDGNGRPTRRPTSSAKRRKR